MGVKDKKIEKVYSSYVSEYHLEMILVPFINSKIEEKENGSYIFMSKKEDDVFFEFKIDVMDENFNLSYIDINTPEKKYHVDFDA